jgi:hypothetical protein
VIRELVKSKKKKRKLFTINLPPLNPPLNNVRATTLAATLSWTLPTNPNKNAICHKRQKALATMSNTIIKTLANELLFLR